MAKVRIQIDRDECIVCGSCWQDCPEVFEEGPDDGFSQIVEQYRVEGDPARGEAPEELKSCVQGAADNCPVEIIHLETR